MKKHLFRNSIFFLFVLGAFTLAGQTSQVDLTTPLAVDPDVRTGKLDNGLVYYLRYNKKPEKRVELRLAVNAGSVLERDDQQGLAHFMEHMNFNGTKSFPHNELIDFLQKTGVRFGADINAYTSFDETVYMLQLPTDDTLLLNKGYQVMEDWAHNALLDDKEIDKERGVIVEEWRLGLGADDRMMKKVFPVIFKGSVYADRIPIGKVEVIQNFKHDLLRDFYNSWYRPDLQAIIVVGDIDLDKAEAKIRAHFSGIKNPSSEKPRNEFDIPDNKEPLIIVTTDKEATQNSVIIAYKHPVQQEKTLGDFREKLIAKLFTGMLNNRLNEISQKPESPYSYAGADYGRFLARNKDAYFLFVGAKESQIDKSIDILLTENERVKRFGFTQTEFDRQKEELLSQYEKDSREFDKTESMNLSNDYVSNFLSGDAIPGARKAFKYVKNLLPGISLTDVNGMAKSYVSEDNLAIAVMAPDKPGVAVPTEADILKIIKDSKSADLQPYVDKFREEPLVTEELKGSKVVSKTENAELGYTELKLANGVTVALKPTHFKNDEILLSAYCLGGNSVVPDDKFMSANFATQVIEMSGAGEFDNVELQKKLKGKTLEIHPFIEEIKEGFRGSSTPKDFETLMQLVYLYFKGPRKDTTAFKAFMSQMENQVKFIMSSPIMSFYDTLIKSTAQPGYKRQATFPTEAQLKQVNLNDLYKIYCNAFANAREFKFFLTGNFSIDTITPVVTKYLGSLPSLDRPEKWTDVSPKFPDGIVKNTLYKGTDPQGMVGIVLSEKFEWNPKNLLELNMLKEIIDIKLIEVIREKMSGVYSPQVMLQPEHYPVSRANLIVLFGCAPDAADKLTKAVFKEMKKIRSDGPTQTDLGKAKETLIRARETDLEKNDFWLGKIESVYIDGTDPASILNFRDRVSAVTSADLKNAANMYLKPDHYVRAVLKPEKK
ncbi:MAG: insulinase family protein [Bacteroidetes bacterium]|nr:insulinase family protein [Bacteroidota bacterium]